MFRGQIAYLQALASPMPAAAQSAISAVSVVGPPIRVYSWLRKGLATAEGNQTYKLIDVHPDKAVIVNTQEPGAPTEIGLAAP